MKTNNNIPAYRFQGYTDAWELRKLGEVAEMYSGGTPSVGKKEFYEGNIPFIRSAEINSHNTELFLSELGLSNSSAKMVNKGDLLYALYGATSGEVGLAKISGAINQAILAIIPSIDYSSNFLLQWLKREKNNIIEKYLQGGQGNLSGAIVKDFSILFPSLPEQEVIGTFFSTLDQQITLHQRKLDTLKEQKKTYLKLLFPAKGQTKPALRFQGFEDDWKEVKLGEIYKFSQGLQVPVEEQFFEPREELVRFIRIVDLTCQNDDIRWVKKNKVGCVSREDIFFVRYGSVGEIGYGFEGIIANNLFKLNPLISLH
ncbi:TPA: restriction endonuclease subunit S, partial [Streptococcus suis]|nr:restriction endonuclease subunit S [Streptococcus suis]